MMLSSRLLLTRCYHRAATASSHSRSRARPKSQSQSISKFRKPSSSSTPPGLNLKLDPRKDGNFEDFKVRRDLATRLSAGHNISAPTSTEKKILTILRSNYSLLSRNAPGTGKSTSLLLHGLNVRTIRAGKYDPSETFPRPNVPQSLLLLNSSFSVMQCQQFYNELYPSPEDKLRAPAHFLYRSPSPEIESQQLAHPTFKLHCHLIVATAPRLLDVISADVSCLPQLDRLAFIGVDDADEQLLSDPNAKGQLNLSNADSKRKPTPSETLIDFLVLLAEDPLGIQFAFVNSSSVSANLRQLIEFKNWATTKPGANAVGLKKLVAVGNPEIDMSKVLPYRRIPKDVKFHALTVKPVQLAEQQQQQQQKQTFEFKNVKIPDVPTGLDAVLELSSPETKSFDAEYRSYRLSLLRKRSNQMKNQHQSKDAASYIFPALKQFLQSDGISKDADKVKAPLLVVIPDTASLKGTLTNLRKLGINAKILAPVRAHFPQNDATTATGNGNGSNVNDEYSTYKDFVSQQDNGAPAVLLTSLHSIKGTSFPNLSTLVCLGIDTVKDAHTLVTLATRLRSHSGLIESESDSNTDNDSDSSDASAAAADKLEKKVVLLAPKNDFGSREALALYRVIFECGLKGIDPVRGVEMESLADYELPSDVDADALED